jgi:protein ECT2
MITDFHLYLEKPPLDQTERWTGRPFRALTVVHPPGGPNLTPTQTEIDKKKFLENLWTVQAKYRTKNGQSVALCSEEREVESRGGRTTIAKTYFNVYQRTSFLREPQKVSVDRPFVRRMLS